MTRSTNVEPLPPVVRATSVPWSPDEAFRRFTADFAKWWPVSTHSIGSDRVKRVVFECQLGGWIYEEFKDGQRFQWGRVTAWDPPRQVALTWHPSKDEEQAQDVVIRFEAVGAGTRVTLTSTGWEKLGARAARERKGYDIGWGSILDVFAGRRTVTTFVFAFLSHAITFYFRITGRLDGEIARAGGRMPIAHQ